MRADSIIDAIDDFDLILQFIEVEFFRCHNYLLIAIEKLL
jgi:hypothetical protein